MSDAFLRRLLGFRIRKVVYRIESLVWQKGDRNLPLASKHCNIGLDLEDWNIHTCILKLRTHTFTMYVTS